MPQVLDHPRLGKYIPTKSINQINEAKSSGRVARALRDFEFVGAPLFAKQRVGVRPPAASAALAKLTKAAFSLRI
jgi:hypothetical protein